MFVINVLGYGKLGTPRTLTGQNTDSAGYRGKFLKTPVLYLYTAHEVVQLHPRTMLKPPSKSLLGLSYGTNGIVPALLYNFAPV